MESNYGNFRKLLDIPPPQLNECGCSEEWVGRRQKSKKKRDQFGIRKKETRKMELNEKIIQRKSLMQGKARHLNYWISWVSAKLNKILQGKFNGLNNMCIYAFHFADVVPVLPVIY